MIAEILFSLFNIAILLTTIRYWKKIRGYEQSTFERIIIKDTIKSPLVIQDNFKYSIYHFNVIGSTYHNHVMREAYHRMIEKIAEEGCIEVYEEQVDQLNKNITLKLTILK